MASSSARRERARAQRRRAASVPAAQRRATADEPVEAEPEATGARDGRGWRSRLGGTAAVPSESEAGDGEPTEESASTEIDEDAPRWGFGDVMAGWAISVLASSVAFIVYVQVSGLPAITAGDGFTIGYALARDDLDLPRRVFESVYETGIGVRALLQVPLWIGLAGAPIVAARRKGISLREDFGFTQRASDIPLGLVIGLACQAGVVLLYLPLGLLVSTEDVSAPAREVVGSAVDPLGFVLLVAVVGLGAPVVEELFYRGLTQRSLIKRGMSPAWAIVLGALFFAFNHLQSLQFPALVFAGLVFGYLAHRTGRLGLAIWAHVGFNMTTVLVLAGFTPFSV